ncbi:MAG: SDR family NAD-dependent epimerase/dehydratase, partial [Rhodospirillales bacterium]|nr:SDR family NAD-dependent epimerase/dehydratase [Rhodospirillales bacterium]
LVRKPLPVDDPLQRKPDIRLAKKLLKWTPAVRLDAGLKKTIAYFDDLLTNGEPYGERRA